MPGHGTSWRELRVTDGRDWYAAAERAFLDLRALCPVVFVAGVSMGGALALRLAEHHADQVRGLILVNPALQGNPKLSLVPLAKRTWCAPPTASAAASTSPTSPSTPTHARRCGRCTP